MIRIISALIFSIITISAFGQTVKVEGYVFETGNRGYLNTVEVIALQNGNEIYKVYTDTNGYFELMLDTDKEYTLRMSKSMFEDMDLAFSGAEHVGKEKAFVKAQMKRSPGYQFEITLAPKRENEDIAVDAIRGALIEVYNNTTKEEVLVLDDHPNPDFSVNLIKGNHYTILVRKEGFMAKRMEAFVDVKGCILCFEGVGSVEPGVSDNLTEGNEMGVLLANVELEPIYQGKKIEIQNIYYALGEATLREESIEELDNVVQLFNDNPSLTIEIGSHTDSRGTTAQNQTLSEDRAISVVKYLTNNGGIARDRLIARGYGENEIKNGCTNGVDCSDIEHQANRRTELKIIGYKEGMPIKNSLFELKEEDRMNDLIKELQNQEQVKVTGDQSLEQIVGSNQGSSQGSIIEEVVEEVEKPEHKKVEEKVEEIVQEEAFNESTDQIFAQAEAAAKEEVEEVKDVVTEAEVTEVVTDENPYAYIDGPKIVIYEGAEFLTPDHEIFTRHQQVFQYLKGSEVFYLIGDFKEVSKAQDFLDSVIKKNYPDAYILKFDKGNIID